MLLPVFIKKYRPVLIPAFINKIDSKKRKRLNLSIILPSAFRNKKIIAEFIKKTSGRCLIPYLFKKAVSAKLLKITDEDFIRKKTAKRINTISP
ncbi:MAG: hypothetical protein KAR07_11095, partial [Spirochaetes bacterium]|nr:hypothetical protein [Spirochaetota bacterium]